MLVIDFACSLAVSLALMESIGLRLQNPNILVQRILMHFAMLVPQFNIFVKFRLGLLNRHQYVVLHLISQVP